jgi:hypothetical protein
MSTRLATNSHFLTIKFNTNLVLTLSAPQQLPALNKSAQISQISSRLAYPSPTNLKALRRRKIQRKRKLLTLDQPNSQTFAYRSIELRSHPPLLRAFPRYKKRLKKKLKPKGLSLLTEAAHKRLPRAT